MVTLICRTCGGQFQAKTTWAKRAKYCSKQCYNANPARRLPTRVYTRRPLAERFWEKVRKGDGCWEWTGCRYKSGYGKFGIDRATGVVPAHRIAYELCVGPVGGLHVLHRCDNRPCVRPDHLFLGTAGDNIRDCRDKGRLRPRGVLFTPTSK